MAKDKVTNVNESPKSQEKQGDKTKRNGIVFGLLAVLTAIAIIVIVFGGAFFILIRNNVNGLADKYRKQIQPVPVLNMVLPKVQDPEDPKLLSDEEIREKYAELMKHRDELAGRVKESDKKIAELQKYKEDSEKLMEESESLKKALQEQQVKLDDKEKKLQEDKQKLDEMVAKNDKAGFKEFFEKIDSETAARLYSEILTEQKADEDTKKFAKIYEEMDAGAAAKIFEEMGDARLDLVVDALKSMNRENSAEILAAMNSSYAAKVTEKLSETMR